MGDTYCTYYPILYYTDLVAEVCVPPVRGRRHVLDHADELVRVQGGQRLGGGGHQHQQGQQLGNEQLRKA